MSGNLDLWDLKCFSIFHCTFLNFNSVVCDYTICMLIQTKPRKNFTQGACNKDIILKITCREQRSKTLERMIIIIFLVDYHAFYNKT